MGNSSTSSRAHGSDGAAFVREPFLPIPENWNGVYDMLCGHCASQRTCGLVDAMLGYAQGNGPWPDDAWVTDPGASATCMSYVAKTGPAITQARLESLANTPEEHLPRVCGGCAAKKGTDASVALHTQRDYRAHVQNRAEFTCHEDPTNKRLCGGWCRAVQRKEA